MISCHNTLPRFVSFEVRQACELIGHVLTWQIAVLDEAAMISHGARVRAVEHRLLRELDQVRNVHAGLIRGGEELLSLMDASGFALCGSDGVTVFGRTPSEDQVLDLVKHFAGDAPRPLFETDCIATRHPAGADYLDIACGILAVPLGRS